MKIKHGQLPEGAAWRVVIWLDSERPSALLMQLGLTLAQANGGEIIPTIILPPDNEQLSLAQAKLVETQSNEPANHVDVFPILIESASNREALADLIKKVGADLLLVAADMADQDNLNQLSCAVGVLYHEEDKIDQLKKILVPTSGSLNTAYRLRFLLPLTKRVDITTLYVTQEQPGGNNNQHTAQRRLKRLLNYVDAGQNVHSEISVAESTSAAITAKSSEYDLIVLGQEQRRYLRRSFLDNTIPDLVNTIHKPVLVIQLAFTIPQEIIRRLDWGVQMVVPNLAPEKRGQSYVRIQRNARPTQEFYTLIFLAAMIAAFGLLLNSGAIIIGAMLVAPLMSPIVGSGMALVLGDVRFLRMALFTVLKGVFLAILVGVLVGILRLGQPLTPEILARTQPGLLDLGVALFSGFAGAYALSHSDAAGALPGVAIAAALVPPLTVVGIAFTTNNPSEGLGALLLFGTNFIAISFATALVFLALGFRPAVGQKDRRMVQSRTIQISILLVVGVGILLFATTYSLAQKLAFDSRIQEVTAMRVAEIDNAVLDNLTVTGNTTDENATLLLEAIVRSENLIPHSSVIALQEQIGIDLQRTVALNLILIRVTKLDPLVPPTPTPTPTETSTPTPGPSPTTTNTPTETPTVVPSPTATETPLPTDTPIPTATETATPTETPTATPVTAVVIFPYGLNLRAGPDAESELLSFLPTGTIVVVLDEREVIDGVAWQQVESDGVVGWVLADYLQ